MAACDSPVICSLDSFCGFEDVDYCDFSCSLKKTKCPGSTFDPLDRTSRDNLPLTAVNKVLGSSCSGLTNIPIITSSSHQDVDAFIDSTIQSNNLQDAFYVLDLAVVVKLFNDWVAALPKVKPYYAVKCNPSPPLLSTLAALGAGFDCASKSEVEQIISMGVSAQRIIFANPCKMLSHIKYASSVGVNLTTYDSEHEVAKVKLHSPNAKLLLRLHADDRSSKWPLGVKYGALSSEVDHLMMVAAKAKLDLVGVSFHIGSGASDGRAYVDAIAAARAVFDKALSMGLPAMHILDIGGGFTVGNNGELKLAEAAKVINAALHEYFPEEMGVSVIAEPGRYFAEAPTTLAAMIYGKRTRGEVREYWINDGIYGTMNCLIHDYAVLAPRPLARVSQRNNLSCAKLPLHTSTVFGPTCDSLDTILKDHPLPDLVDGDWIVFPNMGAYTHCAGSSFNGFDISAIRTLCVFSLNARGSPAAHVHSQKSFGADLQSELLDKLSSTCLESTDEDSVNEIPFHFSVIY
uniref:ornithine decarboxylase n=1 Tax=Phlegmariurus tetrastichus TaxID=1263146 RepID=A0A8F1NN86_9TRAC|nr:lysine decarboxylase 2 [Phlegmariurus tetrastichus]